MVHWKTAIMLHRVKTNNQLIKSHPHEGTSQSFNTVCSGC